jgi:hypothetical protein
MQQTLTLITCERFHCRLLPSACIARQQAAKTFDIRLADTERKYSMDACLNCPQGKQIAQQYPPKKKEPKVEKATPEKEYMCQDCNKQPAAINPKTNKPITGLCRACNGKRIKAAFAKKKEEQLQAKKAAFEHKLAQKAMQLSVKKLVQKNEQEEAPKAETKLKEAMERLREKADATLKARRAAAAAKPPQTSAPCPRTLALDFTPCPDLWERIHRDAAADLRPTGLHALWIIRDYFEE